MQNNKFYLSRKEYIPCGSANRICNLLDKVGFGKNRVSIYSSIAWVITLTTSFNPGTLMRPVTH